MSKRKRRKKPRPKDGYVLLPSVTHRQGREKAFEDAMKAMVRAMIEINHKPAAAYAISKTDRIVTTENRHLLSPEDQAEWDAACAEFDAMSPERRKAWIDNVISTHPKIDKLPDPDSYNEIN